MMKIVPSNLFDKQLKQMIKRGKNINKLSYVLKIMISGQKIPEKYKNHQLKGDYVGFMELHIEPDWLLIYKIYESEILLAQTGTHSDLFKK